MSNNNKIRVAITHGDTNGVGYETILRLLEDNRISDLCTIVVYGSAKAASFYRKAMDLPQVQFTRIDSADDIRDGVFNIINVVPEDLKIEPGVPSEAAGKAALAALETAVSDLSEGKVDVLVTAPINKHTIHSADFNFPGHTEFLQDRLTDESTPEEWSKALMMLCAGDLRVALATTHLPISQVSEAITKELIVDRLERLEQTLKVDFSIEKPRIAVLALNPHAGDDGLLGSEEKDVIVPAIEEAKNKRIMAFGPYAADGFFGSGSYKVFDAVLAMYHDQGLAPFKTLAMDAGVNFTAGLPFVRTSPDHGTGYDIAAKGLASADSLREAVYYALDIYRNRQRNLSI